MTESSSLDDIHVPMYSVFYPQYDKPERLPARFKELIFFTEQITRICRMRIFNYGASCQYYA